MPFQLSRGAAVSDPSQSFHLFQEEEGEKTDKRERARERAGVSGGREGGNMGIEAGGDDDEKVALPSFGGSTAHARPPLPSNPALTLQRGLGSAGSAGAGQGQPRPGGLMRKESFGVPKIKNHKELLKGVFQKKGLPPGLSSLK